MKDLIGHNDAMEMALALMAFLLLIGVLLLQRKDGDK